MRNHPSFCTHTRNREPSRIALDCVEPLSTVENQHTNHETRKTPENKNAVFSHKRENSYVDLVSCFLVCQSYMLDTLDW